MQVSAVLFIEWLKRMDSTEKILNLWLQNAKSRSTYIESYDYNQTDDYYNGTLVWDIPVTETKQIDDPIKSMSSQMYQHLMEEADSDILKRLKQTSIRRYSSMNPYTQSLVVSDNTRSGRLEWFDLIHSEPKKILFESEICKKFPKQKPKHNPLIKPKPKYKVLDFDDNILGEAFTMEEALDTFYTRYAVFDKKAASHFIEEI